VPPGPRIYYFRLGPVISLRDDKSAYYINTELVDEIAALYPADHTLLMHAGFMTNGFYAAHAARVEIAAEIFKRIIERETRPNAVRITYTPSAS
jgi:hypothetical protein